MVFHGVISNGTIILEGHPLLPEGASVRIEVVDGPSARTDDDSIYRIGDIAVPTGIPDLARNIDHYLYGHPRTESEA